MEQFHIENVDRMAKRSKKQTGQRKSSGLFVQSLAGLRLGVGLHAVTACVWTSKVFGKGGVRGGEPFVYKRFPSPKTSTKKDCS